VHIRAGVQKENLGKNRVTGNALPVTRSRTMFGEWWFRLSLWGEESRGRWGSGVGEGPR